MWKVRLQLLGETERQPGLTRAAGASEGNQSVGCDQLEQVPYFPVAAHERGQLCGQVAAQPHAWFEYPRVNLRATNPGRDLTARGEAELVEDLFEVPLDGSLGDKEPTRNITVGHPERHQLGYLLRPSRELYYLAHAAIVVSVAAIRL
jgi:hypothetical protein